MKISQNDVKIKTKATYLNAAVQREVTRLDCLDCAPITLGNGFVVLGSDENLADCESRDADKVVQGVADLTKTFLVEPEVERISRIKLKRHIVTTRPLLTVVSHLLERVKLDGGDWSSHKFRQTLRARTLLILLVGCRPPTWRHSTKKCDPSRNLLVTLVGILLE